MDTIMQTLEQAHEACQQGQYNQAMQICHKVLQQHPMHVKALELMAVIYHYSGHTENAIPYIQKAIEMSPNDSMLHNNMGGMLQAVGRHEDAAKCFATAMQLNPESAHTHLNQANMLKNQHRYAEAIQCCQKALQINPNFPEAYNLMGILFETLCQFDRAIPAYEQALRLKPDFAYACNNMGSAYLRQGLFDEAFACFRRAMNLDPSYATAMHNYGLALKEKGRLNDAIPNYQQALIHEALPYFEKALKAQPDFAMAYNTMGQAYRQLGELEKAEDYFKKAMKMQPEDSAAYVSLGKLYLDQGDVEAARAVYRQAYEAMPRKTMWKVLVDTLCPLFFDSADDIAAYRKATQEVLKSQADADWNVTLADLTTIDCRPSFYLMYQGEDDLPIKAKFADIFEKNLAARQMLPPKPPLQRTQGKPHIGFLVTHGHEGIFCKYIGGIISNLSRETLDLSIICPQEMVATISAQVNTQGVRFCTINNNLETDIPKVRAHGCDVMFYFEVGTDAENYYLPFFHLAPIQMTSWAIPITSGIPAIDYYVSTELIETDTSNAVFSEKLVRFQTLPAYYQRPEQPKTLKPREDYGVTKNDHLYFCPQNFGKLHPDFDDVLVAIYQRDPNAKFGFIRRKQEFFAHRFFERIEKKAPGISERIHFIPWQTQEGYLNVITIADVVLDTLHYGGGTSVYDALSTGTPVITMPSDYHRGRMAYALYQKMGMTDCVANSIKEYADLCVKIATKPKFRETLKQKILASNHALYEDMAAVQEFEQFFLTITKAAPALAPTT